MSAHDYGLLTAHSGHDHFPSAFMQGYHQHQIYDHERYAPLSPVSSQTPLERYLHPMHGEVSSSVARDSYLPYDRRTLDPSPRTTYIPRQPLPESTYPQSFEYTHNPISHSTLLHPPRGSTSATEHDQGLRPVVGFDPRPPHAGWTPKEEVDDDERTRELLAGAGSMRSRARSPEDPQTSLLQSPVEPTRDKSNSPGHLGHSPSTTSKTYAFVSLPGNAVRKRPRRRYDEIERLYACSWPDCTKAYGTLNHLNAHVSMQRHGPKRSPAEFKELRKQWRQQKKQDTVAVSPTSNAGPTTSTTPPGSGLVPTVTTRRRRATESSLSLSLSVDNTLDEGVSAHASHRLSLGDIRYPPHSDDEGNPLGPSPTSTTSDSVAYWQDSPVSPSIDSGHQLAQTQSRASLHYPVAMQDESPGPLSPSNVDDLPCPMNRLPPDSTLLTPLPGYRPPSPQFSRLGPGSTLLQPLPASTLATLSPPQHPRSPVKTRGYEDYQDRRPHEH